MNMFPISREIGLLSRLVILGIAVAVAGCARFSHQTTASEPHAVLRFAEVSDAWMEQAISKTLDGLAVSAGREYRVKPGRHELVCRVVERSVKTHDPKFIGKTTESPKGSTTVGFTIPGETEITYRPKYVTNLFSAEAGWIYDVEGENVSKASYLGK